MPQSGVGSRQLRLARTHCVNLPHRGKGVGFPSHISAYQLKIRGNRAPMRPQLQQLGQGSNVKSNTIHRNRC